MVHRRDHQPMSDLDALLARRPELRPAAADLGRAFDVLLRSIQGGGKILACGNGGSASDAEHLVGELMKGFNLRRPLAAAQVRALKEAFPDGGEALAGKLQGAIP